MVGRAASVGEPAQVVVEHLVQADLPGQRPLEHRGVLERLAAAIDGPDLQVVDPLDEVAGEQGEVARAALVAGHQDEHPIGPAGPDLARVDVVVLRRARAGGVEADQPVGGARRCRHDQAAEHGECDK